MRTLEGNDIGDEAMRVVQAVIHGRADIGLVVPAEGFKHFRDEAVGIGLGETAIMLGLFGEREGERREDLTAGEDFFGFGAQVLVVDQVEAQQRGEDAERVALQGFLADRAKGSRVDRNAGGRKIVIANRIHAHDGKHAAHHRKLGRGAEADRAVALLGDTLQRIGVFEAGLERRVGGKRVSVDLRHQFHQRAVGRNLGAVHGGHCGREGRADVIGGNETILFHGGTPRIMEYG